jgi:carboxyl-terminal processing protease
MKMAAKADGEEGSELSKFPYGVEPMKLEAINIMRDFLDLTTKRPTTAKADEKPAK